MSRDKSQKFENRTDRDDESVNCCQLDVHKALIREKKASRHKKDIDLFSKRSCTDVFCLFVFIAAVCGWVGVSIFVFMNGGPERAWAPVDSDHRRCGFDNGVEDSPYLFYFDITKCLPPRKNLFFCDTPQVCVSECPKTNFSLYYYLQNHESFRSIKAKLICLRDFNKDLQINSYGDVRNAIEGGYCADWYMESEPIFRHCLPRQLYALNSNVLARISLPGGSDVELNGVTPKLIRSAMNEIRNTGDFFQKITEDILKSWPWIIIFTCVAMFLCLIFIIIMRWISGIIVWTSIFGLIALLSFSSYYTWTQYSEIKEQKKVLDSSKVLLYAKLRINPSQLEDDILKHEYTWFALFILSVLSLTLIVIILIFLRSRIRLAIELIKEGSKAVSYAWTSLIFPPFSWALQLLIFVQAAFIFCFLIGEKIPIYRVSGLNGTDCFCSNGYKEGDICDVETFKAKCFSPYASPCPIAQCAYSANEAENYTVYLHLFNLLMLLWAEYFVSGFGQMSLAMTFATCYWTTTKRKLPACIVGVNVFRVIRYHLGTVALGSFLLALLNWIRILVEAFYRYIYKNDSSIIKCLRCCCGCALACLHKLLRILTKNAYIMCAMKGTNYCTSAKHAFDLIIKNVICASVLDGVTTFLFFLMKLLITIGVGAMAYYFFSNPIPDLRNPDDGNISFDYYFSPIIVICLATFFIASLFFGVYASAVDTIFLCALEDLDRNTGSPEKPYAMSKGLIKIFKVKNKRSSCDHCQ